MRTTIFVAVGRGPALPQLTIDHRPSCAVRCGKRDAHEVRRIAANIAKLSELLRN
jgi:hypothetical protein